MRSVIVSLGLCVLLAGCLKSNVRDGGAGSGGAGSSGSGGGGGTGAIDAGMMVCVPGSTVRCACANGVPGAQTCLMDGSGFGACFCGGGGSGAVGGTGGVSGSSGSGGVGGTAGVGGGCSPACGVERTCCGTSCVNTNNDPLNCGMCGVECSGLNSLCSAGTCIEPACTTTCTGGTCCGNTCCGSGEICCEIEGPVTITATCVAPVNGTCPQGCAPLCICNSPDTSIATIDGERPIAALEVGDLVYSVDHGALTLVPIARVNRVPVVNHHVMHVVLSSGSVLEISPSHPLTDGRVLGDLRAGDTLDHATVISAVRVAYPHDFTYDILPASDTGFYVAGGVLIASTLR